MKQKQKPIIRVHLNDGTYLIGTEIELTEQFFREHNIPREMASNAFPGIWLLHHDMKKVSFLAHEIILNKETIKV